MAPRDSVTLMDVSPKQLVSVAASLIPFLENDDANRALMGSNMQRQAVPLLRAEAPFVGTGMEETVARDSGAAISATRSAWSTRSTPPASSCGLGRGRCRQPGRRHLQPAEVPAFEPEHLHQPAPAGEGRRRGRAGRHHRRRSLDRSRRARARPQQPRRVHAVERLQLRGLDPDLRAHRQGRRVHLDPHRGVRGHGRDTKLGPEDITRDIPNVGEEALRNLDEAGIVYIGAEVHPGDILVGKITPKGEVPMTPEEKLLRAIFGEKASDVRDTSLKLPPGVSGTIVEVRVFNRHGIEIDDRTRAIQNEEIERLKKDSEDERNILNRATYNRLREMLEGQVAAAAPKGIKKGAKIDAELLETVDRHEWFKFAVADDGMQGQLEAVKGQYDEALKRIKGP
jgi:DNA-directed RNA polymerase subunit beta